VQATGDLVAATAELAAGVQDGQDDFDGRLLLTGDLTDRDPAAVIGHPHPAVRLEHDVDRVAVAGQRLVDGVVDDLVHQVVQAALAGRADVHAGALADRFETFEHRDRAGVVLRRLNRQSGLDSLCRVNIFWDDCLLSHECGCLLPVPTSVLAYRTAAGRCGSGSGVQCSRSEHRNGRCRGLAVTQ